MKPSKSNRSKAKKKRKPSSPSPAQPQFPSLSIDKPVHLGSDADGVDERRSETLTLAWLTSAFSSVPFEQIASAYAESGRDPFKAAGILTSTMKPSESNNGGGNKKKMKKKKRNPSLPSLPQSEQIPRWGSDTEGEDEQNETLDLNWLTGAFSSLSFDQIASAYTEAGRDPFKTAGILGAQLEDPEDALQAVAEIEEEKRKKKKKAVAASSGIVADVIGREYVKPSSNGRREVKNGNGKDRKYSVEEGEEFLCSMLGESSELGMGVVKDVLCQCGNDVEKALDALLDISSSYNQSMKRDHGNYSFKFAELSSGASQENDIYSYQITDKTSDSTYHPSEKENDILQYAGYGCRSRDINPALQQKVLESLFKIPDSPTNESNSMNWKKLVQQVESFGQGLEYRNGNITEPLLNTSKENEYQVCRSVARKHWDTMKDYYQKAAVAYSRGERAHATQLSETGRIHRDLARKEDEKASREIFKARNKGIRNVVTIDLHGQHVKQGIQLLKLHLMLFTYIPSIQFLKVITGCGGDGPGNGKLKRTVISLVKREGIDWCEENSGTLLLRLDGLKEYNFMEEDDYYSE
ncbi:SMR domain-containing protein At5g58720 isoform X2 [Asparagus officinalis]|uniref:SMR domain-containing protein At5g58720 isoform X2 n=1 Tax=Asparagus officinalis TaxID=4686 RepID=UPI00098E14DD|nr:SMR domain-containing protein At5g58720 isoform X2 [Asparagus officinalis]